MRTRTEARRTALVTGASRGIGRAIALELARRGADVAVNFLDDAEAAAGVVATIEQLGLRAVAVQADVTDADAAHTLAATVAARLGQVDVLVNNVGDFQLAPLAETSAEAWRHVLDSNLSSAHYMCQAVLPSMRQRASGSIVNIALAPVHLVRAAAHIAPYAIAKTGIVILTRSLAVEEAAHGIRVNCVSPGLIDNGHLAPAERSWMTKRVPLGRLGRPEDVAAAVAFLVSDEAAYVSGANLSVAGGWDWEDRPTDHDGEVRDVAPSPNSPRTR